MNMNKIISSILLCCLHIVCVSQNLVINEVVGYNTVGYMNTAAKTPDWIELKNVSTQTIQLSQFSIADRETKSTPWQLPDIQLAPGKFYIIEATNPKDGIAEWETIIDKGDVWKYIVPTYEPSLQWKYLGFDDNSWQQGPSGFGYADNDDATILPACMSVFIRKTFTISDVSIVSSALLHMDYDDGFVAYLNGVEIARASISGNPPAYDAGAYGHEANWFQNKPIESFTISNIAELLQAGENVLCIQVHNSEIGSSDLSAIPIFSVGYSEPKVGNAGISSFIQLPQTYNSAPFKVNAKSETIYLFQGNIIIDSISMEDLPQDVSIGRPRNDIKKVVYFSNPTAGKENPISTSVAKTLSKPLASMQSGVYKHKIEIALFSPDAGVTIFYTTDGSVPTEDSQRYTGEIPVAANTNIRCRAYKQGYIPSEIVTYSYIFFQRTHRLPVVSVTFKHENFFDWETGIYELGPNAESWQPNFGANFWQDWERPCHVEVFNPDGSTAFSHNLGVKIAGNWSRANPQKSLKFYARDKYGDEAIEYQIFKDKPIYSFQSFILRNSGNDYCNSQMRDGTIQSLCRNMGLDYQAYQPAVVYLNGEYWGILNFREKINKDFIAGNHNLPLETFAILNIINEPVYGDIQNFRDLYNFMEQNDLSIPANYDRVKQDLDIDNYIKYNVVEMFAVNEDWPGNNMKAWREYGSEGKWRYILYDLDFGFGIWEYEKISRNMLTFALMNDNSIGWPNPPWSTLMLRKLTENQEFNALFLNHVADRLNTTFHPDSITNHIDSIKNLIVNELSFHAQRWGANEEVMKANIEAMKVFGTYRGEYMRQHFEEYFNTGGSYTLSVTSTHSNPGRIHVNTIDITSLPWEGKYFNNNTITLTAIPAPGYTFVGWQGAVVSANPTISLTPSSYTSVHAVFSFSQAEVPQIVISEINYNSAANLNTGDWIELFNQSLNPQDISGWRIATKSPNKEFVFPQGTILSAQSYCIVSSSISDFNSVYPLATYMRFSNESFSLATSQETIMVYDSRGFKIQELSYTDQMPYPKKCDGYGYTLASGDENQISQNPYQWRSATYTGTPGSPNNPIVRNSAYANIHISEVMHSNHDNAKCGDWIELYNSGNSLVDVSGWVLRDRNNSIAIFSEPTVIPSKSYVVFCEEPQKFSSVYPAIPCIPINIGFKSSGDFIRLADEYEFIIDSVEYTVFSDIGVITNGTSRTLIREFPDNTWKYSILGGTPQAANKAAHVAISEVSESLQYIYPNPCSNFISVQIPELHQLTLFTLSGQEVLNIQHNCNQNISVSHIQKGTYIAEIRTKQDVYYQLIIKK